MRYRRVNWGLRRQIFLKAHPEGAGNSDLQPSVGIPHGFWHIRESQDCRHKKGL